MKSSLSYRSAIVLRCVCLGLLLPSTFASAQDARAAHEPTRARITRPTEGQTLTPPANASPLEVVGAFLKANGASDATVASLRVVSESRSALTGIRHLRLEQTIAGLPVYGAYVKAAVNDAGALTHLIENLVAGPQQPPRAAAISEVQALRAAMNRVHPGVVPDFREAARENGRVTFAGGSFFHRNPSVSQVLVPLNDGSLRIGFLVETWSQVRNLLDHTVVGPEGVVVATERRTNNDGYNVFVEDPLKGKQSVVSGPGSTGTASPIGWLGSGPQSTVNISGNNAWAYLDSDANNAPDSGGAEVTDGNFLTKADLSVSPTTSDNRAVAVQNLFYLNNWLHDVLYAQGFTEPNGNFQENNFGRGGLGSDSVMAEAQDGSGTDNANFATPSDGSNPRMQMYLWTGTGGDHEVVVGTTATYDAMGAEFGAKLTTAGLSGVIVEGNDGVGITSDGCEAFPAGSLSGKIALVDRGTCNFTVKVRNAQTAGAIAVIVANNSGETEIFTMGGTDRKVRIPSVMISQNHGAALRSLIGPSGVSGTTRKKSTPPPQIDGDLDADIVFHEYGHGLTWRMIGSMSGPLAGAVGEGASDVLAFLLNGDDRIGEYSYSNDLGIRRFPYSGYPNSYGDVTGSSVHNDGEIYAAAMWRLYELMGDSSKVLAYFVDGMNYTPAGPAFEDMRDGMLQASPPADHCLIWRAFAKFGIGVGADGRISRNRLMITESTAVPAGCPSP